jgi:hypothetical protein
MEKINNKIQLYIKLPLFLVILIFFVFISNNQESINLLNIIYQVPKAIAVYAIGGFIFTRWLWKCDFWKGWLIKIPNIQGTWKGRLESTWINTETKLGIDAIPMFLVIKQNFNKIECSVLTKESSSYSLSADIQHIHGNLQLSYAYTNIPKTTFRDKSKIHNGAALLKIIDNPKRKLSGAYWTDIKTGGDIHVEFFSKELKQEFIP